MLVLLKLCKIDEGKSNPADAFAESRRQVKGGKGCGMKAVPERAAESSVSCHGCLPLSSPICERGGSCPAGSMRVVPREHFIPSLFVDGIFNFKDKELNVLEEIKLKLLQALEKNHRVTTATLATMFNREEDEIISTIRELEENKVILGYVTLVDWEKTGHNHNVTAVIDVQVTPQRDVGFDVIAERICRFPEVKSVYLMSGGYDLSVMVEGTSLKEVAFFVSEKLASLENVQSTATHFVLKKYKQNGIFFDEDKKDHRLVVSP